MAPLRRYLRITKYSVLECRIYLDNPALAQSWLLNPRDPVLPRVIESVRPLVLPKLREERERSRKKSTKKRGIKDTVTEDDFEVSIFLTETSTRHSMLYKHKHFRDTTQTKLTSNSSKLVGASREAPVLVEGNETDMPSAPILREEDDDDVLALQDIPKVDQDTPVTTNTLPRTSKRRRGRGTTLPKYDDAHQENSTDATMISDDDALFVSQDEDSSEDDDMQPPQAKRRKDETSTAEPESERDDKKKLAMDISYEGFSIYGRVLCLVVKQRGDSVGNKGRSVAAAGGQQAMMENWITSTQMPEAVANGLLEAT
ncbi:hypothetical protein N0V93_001655 [Gnomoniopsis smithogilvyi]|uniref:Uncharacterized protein n=1 Tax=Gnomoniopsis smithogilvyi TaxID=1191159 RepID=A0A9W9D1F0_9PEZI|nr:hypothetical protein N0V93_001655 [Gnomoniopsis smithogilvyi]